MADSKAHKPGGLLDQYNLLGAIIDASWATRLDHKVARHIIDRYYPKHGNGRASLRYLERATGASRPNVIASVRRLAEQGAIVLVRQGQGTRPSEFSLNFEFPSSGIADDTTSTNEPSGSVNDTTGGIAHDTSSASSGIADDTESYLLNPAYKAEIQKDRDDTRPPTAPPLAGLSAATAGTAVEELASSQAKPTFELCYRTYDCLKGKREAKAAWDALPAEVDRAAVIRVAAAWQASWAAQGKPDAPRKHLATWLREERYDEDPPRGFKKVERAKATKPKAAKPARLGLGINIKRYTITAYKNEGSPFADYWETFTFRRHDDGFEFTQRMHVLKVDADVDEAPDFYRKVELIKGAFGKGNPAGEWVGRVLGINEGEEDGLGFHYLPEENPPLPEPAPQPALTGLDTNPVSPPAEPADYGTKEWERRYTARQERAAGMREWDKAHPELFEDKPAANDDWPAWMDAEYEYEEDDEAA
ncbi:hypothetical protein BST63_19665 [Bradyrhizobium canariense]|uniref:Helix-turn-helix domain-containing protein n=1 Tax=Bradyrhizobium canariense TaxID=255045 RepID=A0ABX3X2H1_9BRAD|nr:hypothetical protein [Bradyrhizobium canariense]OSJ19776.1 hypothetical protein BSR47_01240 [Bradyrhizobium canariense]OSJ27483.1 hypothetical protein BST63_19665 [Bradyrhizobium canariense]